MKGSRPVVQTNYTRERFHIIGARTPRTFVFRFIARQTQKAFIRFVRTLLVKYPRLVLFVDNAPWHRGKTIRRFCHTRSKTLRLYYFLPYSPELNPVEQHWKLTKQAIANRVLRSIPATQYHVRNILSRRERMPRMFKYLMD